MNLARLIWLNFIKGRPKSNLCIVIAVAIAAAAIAGAGMVGTSVRHSLKTLALKRLGDIDSAVIFPDFVPQDITKRLIAKNGNARVNAAIFTSGSALGADGRSRCNNVKIHAASHIDIPRGSCIINDVAAEMLSANTGDEILISMIKNRAVSASSPLTGLKRSEQLGKLRLDVSKIENGSNFISRFDIYPTQRAEPVIWISLADAQRAVNAQNKINCILGSDISGQILSKTLKPSDYGVDIKVNKKNTRTIVSTKAVHLPPAVENTLNGHSANRVLTGLLESCEFSGKLDHYALASGMDSPPGGELPDDSAAVNQWLADRLGLSVGEDIQIKYFARLDDGSAGTKITELNIKRIVPTAGIDADKSLTPTYPGMTDTDSPSPSEWKIPGGLNIDLTLVDLAEEDYWDKYRAAPRIFVNYQSAAKLWGKGQSATSVRFNGPAAKTEILTRLNSINPQDLGIQIIPVRKMQLEAAAGSSDFDSLFLSLSGLIYIVAFILVLLTAMLAKKSMQSQFAILNKLGIAPRQIKLACLYESLLCCVFGAIISIPVAIAFGRAVMFALGNIWIGATGTKELSFTISPLWILIGSTSAAMVSWIICAVCYKELYKISGTVETGNYTTEIHHDRRKSRLHTAANAMFAVTFGLSSRGERARFAILAALMAVSIYGAVLTLFFSMPKADSPVTDRLIVSDLSVPLPVVPSDTANRRLLGADDNFEQIWGSSICTGIKIHAGESIACNNMTRPSQPAIAAIDLINEQSKQVLQQFGMYSELAKILGNPLAKNENNAIKAAADTASAQYILKKSAGDTLTINDSAGNSKNLLLAGTFKTNCLDGEIIVSSEDFDTLFAPQNGFSRLLIAADSINSKAIKTKLAELLEDYGPQTSTLTELTSRRAELQNTYLAAFRSLGLIAAALGVIGLWLSTYRSLLDKKRQLTMMWAVGWPVKSLLGWACGQHILAVLIGFLLAAAASAPLLGQSHVNHGRIIFGILMGFSFVIATIIVQVIMTYRFVGKLNTKSLTCQ